MRGSLASGVKAVSAPELFETPASLAEQMVRLAGIARDAFVLEPSAGTGRIATAIDLAGGVVQCVEINSDLCTLLRQRFTLVDQGDFLEWRSAQRYDAVVMNPPFGGAADIVHVKRALGFLRPGGVLVAIVANGPRQQRALKSISDQWEALPADTFRGTSVHAALIVIRQGALR
jgi:predicted RNA methylase